jgi:dTMP kinase
MSRGRFITFEGIDGCGKSTQVTALATHLRESGKTVTITREPGGSVGGEAIRKLLIEGDRARWSPETEILLFTAARRDHIERVISPALESGAEVLCDRYVDSTRIYQGLVRASLRDMVDELHSLAIGLEPDVTIILDLDPLEATRRRQERGIAEDRFEKFGVDFQKRLRDGFLSLADEFPHRCSVISATGRPEEITRQIQTILET